MFLAKESSEVIVRETDQGKYLPPEITVLEITPEKGFAASSSTADWGSLTWGN
jgi:hypothetical protein